MEILIISVIALSAIIVIQAFYIERKRQMSWHHKMMLDAWQEGWDAACEMMQYREETKR